MIRAVKQGGVIILNPPDELASQLKQLLTFFDIRTSFRRVYPLPHSPTKTEYWKQNKKGDLILPRNILQHPYAHYLFEKYRVIIEDQTTALGEVDLGTPIKPRDQGQVQAINSLVTQLQAGNTDGLLIAPTGAGKTVMLLEVARQLRQPTLWLTHRIALMEQGAQRAREYLNVTPGFIGGGKWDIQPITFAVANTLARRELQDLSRQFGTVIIDEAHLFAAEFYLEPILNLRPKFLLATTATPNRRDGLFKIISYTVGPVLYEISEHQTSIMSPEINLVRMPTQDFKPSSDLTRLRRQLARSSARNEKIVSKIASLLAEKPERRVLVFAIDLEHATILKKQLSTCRPDVVVELIVSRTSPQERVDILQRATEGKVNVLITIKIAREGLDVPSLTTGFHTCPHDDKDRLAQEIGRIRRIHNGKTLCEWFDCIDFGQEKIGKLAKFRLEYYRAKGFHLVQ